MKNYILLCLTLFGSFYVEARSDRRRASSLSGLKLRVGKSKELRGYDDIKADPASAVHITKTLKGHEITPRKEEFVVLKFYIDGDQVAEKGIDIRPRAEDPDVSVGFGFGFGHPGYWYDDPWYNPWYGWRRGWGHGHPRHHGVGWSISVGG